MKDLIIVVAAYSAGLVTAFVASVAFAWWMKGLICFL